MYQVTPQQTVMLAVAPAQWEIYALLPAMIIMMVFAMMFKLISKAPEILEPAAEVAKGVATVKGRKALPPGGR